MQIVFGQAFAYIIEALAGLYIFVLLLRFWLPLLYADFSNPIAQVILRISSPVVIPIRRVVPPIGRIDTATILAAYLVQFGAVFVTMSILGMPTSFALFALLALTKLISLTINLFAYAILIRIVLSWLSTSPSNPAIQLVHTLTEPVLRPFRQWIPPVGGFDISPIFAMIALFALNILVTGAFMSRA